MLTRGAVLCAQRALSARGMTIRYLDTPALSLALSRLESDRRLLITLICHGHSLFRAIQDARHCHMPMDLKSASSVRGTVGAWGWVGAQVAWCVQNARWPIINGAL